MLKYAIISLLLTFALGCLAGSGDKALDPSVCDGLLAEAALNREHGQLARAQELEEEARALGCTD